MLPSPLTFCLPALSPTLLLLLLPVVYGRHIGPGHRGVVGCCTSSTSRQPPTLITLPLFTPRCQPGRVHSVVPPPHPLNLQLLLPLLLSLSCPRTKDCEQHLYDHADGDTKAHLLCVVSGQCMCNFMAHDHGKEVRVTTQQLQQAYGARGASKGVSKGGQQQPGGTKGGGGR